MSFFRITRLRDMKRRLLSLKGKDESEWNAEEKEFLRSIYESNLSTLLDSLV